MTRTAAYRRGLGVIVAGMGLFSPCLRAWAQTAGAPPAAPAIEATVPLEATLMVNGRTARVKLVGHSEQGVAFVDQRTANGKTQLLKPSSIEECYFKLELKRSELDEALAKRQWMPAAAKLLDAVKPALPYLYLPNNNAAELVLNAGDCIMRAADLEIRNAETEEQTAKALKKYEAAYAVMKQAAKADWSSDGLVARVKSIKCLLELNKPKTAAHYFEQIELPFPGDAAYGSYWLVKAEIEAGKKNWREAMDAATKSLCFENKDIDTFPDALLLSALCYEEMQEWHRARDVYYEVARLFPQTDWQDIAARRLNFIMDKGLTTDEEQRPIENVFFGFNEDLQALSKKFLDEYNAGRQGDEYSQFDEKGEQGEAFGEKDLDAPQE